MLLRATVATILHCWHQALVQVLAPAVTPTVVLLHPTSCAMAPFERSAQQLPCCWCVCEAHAIPLWHASIGGTFTTACVRNQVAGLALHPSQSLAATSGGDGSVLLWAPIAVKGGHKAAAAWHCKAKWSHRGGLQSVEFSGLGLLGQLQS